MDMAEGEDAGSDLYLIKPVLATKLLNMVGDVPVRRQPAGQAAADAARPDARAARPRAPGRRRGPRGGARRRVRDALRPRGVAARGAGGGPRALPRVASRGTSTPSPRSWTRTRVFVSESGPPARGREAVRVKWARVLRSRGAVADLGAVRRRGRRARATSATRGASSCSRGRTASGKPVTERGEYLSIWRKQQDGAWRLVVDSSLPAADPGVAPVKGAPSRVITEGASGDLRYSLVATRVEPATDGPEAGAGRERRVVARRAARRATARGRPRSRPSPTGPPRTSSRRFTDRDHLTIHCLSTGSRTPSRPPVWTSSASHDHVEASASSVLAMSSVRA